jgi:hypothetical protein
LRQDEHQRKNGRSGRLFNDGEGTSRLHVRDLFAYVRKLTRSE